MIIGLTGSFGTGKSTVAAMFKGKTALVIDADRVVHKLLSRDKKIIKKVAKAFPHAILQGGKADRRALASIVFQNPRDLKKLTTILYPEALREVKRQIALHKRAKWIILDVPLLFEAGWDRLCDTTIAVRATRNLQIERLQNSLGLNRAAILRRIKLQMPLTEKCRRADIIIDNSGPLHNTHRQVDAIINRLNKREKSSKSYKREKYE